MASLVQFHLAGQGVRQSRFGIRHQRRARREAHGVGLDFPGDLLPTFPSDPHPERETLPRRGNADHGPDFAFPGAPVIGGTLVGGSVREHRGRLVAQRARR